MRLRLTGAGVEARFLSKIEIIEIKQQNCLNI